MSEYVFCCIQVKLPTSWGDDHSKPRIIAELDDVLSDGFISWPAEDDQATMWEVDGEACGLDDDRLSAALDHLVRLRVPFVAASEAKWGIDPELRVFDGNEEGRVDKFYGYDRPLIDLNDLERLGSFEAARDHLAAGNRYVGEFSIDHLPAEEPIINPVASALKRGVIRQRIEVEDVAESDEDTATFASELAGELLDEDHDQGGLMERYYEQIVVLRVRVSEDEQGGAPSDWNWTELLDLARPDGAEVIAASENLGPNKG